MKHSKKATNSARNSQFVNKHALYYTVAPCPAYMGWAIKLLITEHSKVKTEKFLLHTCTKCKMILYVIILKLLFHSAACSNVKNKQGNLQPTTFLYPNLLKFLMTLFFFSYPPSINFRKPAKLQCFGTNAAFPSHCMLRTSFLCQHMYYFLTVEKKKNPPVYCSFFLFLNIHIFNPRGNQPNL